jgi:ketosteroid isomerase-like protein
MASESPHGDIQGVLARWSHLLDDRDYEHLVELLTPDAVMHFPSGVEHVGRAAIRDAVAAVQPERPIKHLMGLPDIELLSESEAIARTDMVSFILEAEGGLRTGVASRYFDRLRLVDGRWMFEARWMRAPGMPGVDAADL